MNIYYYRLFTKIICNNTMKNVCRDIAQCTPVSESKCPLLVPCISVQDRDSGWCKNCHLTFNAYRNALNKLHAMMRLYIVQEICISLECMKHA